MGMFDWIKFEIDCPICGEKVDGFQSKDKGCFLDNLDYWEVDHFYSSCPKCNSWIEFIKKEDISPLNNYEMRVEGPKNSFDKK